jgi:hypothetical protein
LVVGGNDGASIVALATLGNIIWDYLPAKSAPQAGLSPPILSPTGAPRESAAPQNPTSSLPEIDEHMSRDEIVREFRNYTNAQAEKFASEHVGKWIKITETVFDVSHGGSTILVVIDRSPHHGTDILPFDQSYASRLDALSKKDEISARCQIAEITTSGIGLSQCRLLGVPVKN